MRLIDEQYTARPFFGSRRMTLWLTRQGRVVNRKRVRRLMQLEAIHPKPRLSGRAGGATRSTRTCRLRDVAPGKCGRPT